MSTVQVTPVPTGPATSPTQVVVTTQTIPDLETPEQKYARLYSSNPPTQEPQATAPVAAPVQYALPPEVAQTLTQLQSELQELRQGRQPSQQTPTPQSPAPAEDPEWVKKIREGDFKGAEAAMVRSVKSQIASEMEEQAFQKATTATQVQLEIDRHLTRVRMENPDIARFERYLQAPVNARVEAARNAGKIRTTDDFVREYKNAVDEEVKELRNLGLQYRADGKQEATTRIQQVNSSFTPTPQQVGEHTSQGALNTQAGESQDDYFARRQQSANRLRNL